MAAPEKCPDCGGPLAVERVDTQYQEEIVRRTYVRRFRIPICRCQQCAKRVQGRQLLRDLRKDASGGQEQVGKAVIIQVYHSRAPTDVPSLSKSAATAVIL